ncbi:MAG: hypothetical protein IKH27_09880 [Oscillospiraceae bacterium]|nr:hypothetical protein [Oscillospiraceae bacterium]
MQDKKQPVEWDEDQWITFHWICGHDGELVFPDDFIFDSDPEQFKANPQAYECTFRLFNSY